MLTSQPDSITAMIDQFAVQHAGNAAYTANLIAAAARENRIHAVRGWTVTVAALRRRTP